MDSLSTITTEENHYCNWISDYDVMYNFNGDCKIETNKFTNNLNYITIMNKNDKFYDYLHKFTYDLINFDNIIYHSWICEFYDGLYAKFYVPQGTPPLLKNAIFFAWINYSYNSFPNSVTIYEDYCGTLYECDDYKYSEKYFYKELIKIAIEKDIFEENIIDEIIDKIKYSAINF